MIRRVPDYTSRIRVLDSEDLIGGPLYPLPRSDRLDSRELENTPCKRHREVTFRGTANKRSPNRGPTLLAWPQIRSFGDLAPETDLSNLHAIRSLQNENVPSLRNKLEDMT